MQFDELFHQCETDPQSITDDPETIIRLFEHFENQRLPLGRDAYAVIRHCQGRAIIQLRSSDSDPATIGCIPSRVADDVAADCLRW